jgi:hypothetical protein
MIRFALSLAAFVALLPASQSQPPAMWSTINRACGKLVLNNSLSTYSSDNLKGVGKAMVRLYARRDDLRCCSDLSPVAEARTSRSGIFEFKGVAPGKYWLAANDGKTEYVLSLTFELVRGYQVECSDQLFVIQRSGKFELMRTIVLD